MGRPREADDPADFDALVREAQPRVTRYLLARTGSPAEAGELTQETFVRAYCALAKGDRPRHAVAWLLAIARNVFLEAARSQRYQRQLRERMARMMGVEWQSPWQERAENRLIVGSAVGSLPPELREPVLLHYFAGLSLSEVASHLEITAGAVKTRLWRARRALRGELEILVSDTEEKLAIFTMPRDLAARAKSIADRPPLYDSLCVELQVGGRRWPTAPMFDPLFSGEGLSKEGLRFAVGRLHAVRLAGDRPLSRKLELYPLLELFDHPEPVEVWSFLRSAEIGTEDFQSTEESRLVPTDGWRLGTDPKAPGLLADFRQAGLRHVWFTFAGLEQTHDDLCQRSGAFAAIVTAMRRCRDAGIETGANIIVSTRNTGEVKELAELLLSLGAEKFIPTYVPNWCRERLAYEDIRPEPEDLADLPPKAPDVHWGYEDFWADPELFTEAALTRAATQAETRGPSAVAEEERGLPIWVAANLDVLMSGHSVAGGVPSQRLANLRSDSPQRVYDKLTKVKWPARPPSDAELAARYGNTESRTVYSRPGYLRPKWLEAWRTQNDIAWLPPE